MTRTLTIAAVLTMAACASTTTPDFDTHPTDAWLFAEVRAAWTDAGFPSCELDAPREAFASDVFESFGDFTRACTGRESGDMNGRACLTVDGTILIADGTTTGAELRELRAHEMLHTLARDCAGLNATDHMAGVFEPAQQGGAYVLQAFRDQ